MSPEEQIKLARAQGFTGVQMSRIPLLQEIALLYNEAYYQGVQQGHADGYQDGCDETYNDAYQDGYNIGITVKC